MRLPDPKGTLQLAAYHLPHARTILTFPALTFSVSPHGESEWKELRNKTYYVGVKEYWKLKVAKYLEMLK